MRQKNKFEGINSIMGAARRLRGRAAGLMLAAAVALGAGFAAPAFAADALKIGSDCTYPPFIYKDASGEVKGFEVDISNEIARRLNMQPERQCVTFDGLLPGLMAGKYDVVIAALDATPARAKRVDFSIPYYRAPAAFVGPKSLANAPVENGRLAPSFMKGKTVGLLRASIYEKYLEAAYPDAKIARYDTMDDALIDLKAGRVDMTFTDMPKAESDFLDKPGNQDFAFIGPQVMDYAVLGEGSAAAVRKGNAALLAKINAALKAMMADGTYEKINRQYWNFSVKP